MEEFGVGQISATWGLTLFVVGYGLSPMIFGTFQEMAAFGRTPLYILFLGLYVIFQLPIIFAKNIGTIFVARFLTGFFAGPALATVRPPIHDTKREKKLTCSVHREATQ